MKNLIIFIALMPFVAISQKTIELNMKRLPDEILISTEGILVTTLKINPISIDRVEAVLTIKNLRKKPILLVRRGLPQMALSAYIFHVIDPNIDNLIDNGKQDHGGLLFGFQPEKGERLPKKIEPSDLLMLNADDEQTFICNLATNFNFSKNIKYRAVYSVAMPLYNSDGTQLFEFSKPHDREIPVFMSISSENVYFEIE
jgi:hypothetical protein